MKSCFSILVLLVALIVLPKENNAQGRLGTNKPSTEKKIKKKAARDSSSTDSIPEIFVKPRTLEVSLDQLLDQKPFRKDVIIRGDWVPYFDKIDRMDGFLQTLGQTGKPYRRYLYGVNASFFRTDYLINPVAGNEEAYALNPKTEVNYYDTRTPYVNAQYAQGTKKLTNIGVEGSINVNPFVNTTFYFKHIKATGAYLEHSTDHFNIAFSTHGHTLNDRFHIFASGVYNQLEDQMNGGTLSNTPIDSSFDKSFENLALTEANLVRRHRAITLNPVYRFFDDSTASPHHFQVSGNFLADDFYQQYVDESFFTILNSFPIPSYPTIPDSSNSYEKIAVSNLKLGASLGYAYEKEKFIGRLRAGIDQNRIGHRQRFQKIMLYKTVPYVTGGFSFDGDNFKSDLDARGEFTFSNLYTPAYSFEANYNMNFGPELVDYVENLYEGKDTLDGKWYEFVSHQPLDVEAVYSVNNRNPSFYQTYFQGHEYSTYTANPNLDNQLLNHFRATLSFTGRRKRKNEREFLPMKASITGWVSAIDRMTWYDSLLTPRQAGPNDRITSAGLTLKFRVNLSRIYLENETVFQRVLSAPDNTFGRHFSNNIPRIYGKASLFYEVKGVKIFKGIRAGFDLYYRTRYNSLAYDPASQQFYPLTTTTNATDIFPYLRVDVVATINIKSAFVFLKLAHANEGIGVPGYYSTPYYPMLERTFFFGVNWTFLN